MSIEMFHVPEGTDIITDEPHRCPSCYTATFWFRNINGKTRCLECSEGLGDPFRLAATSSS